MVYVADNVHRALPFQSGKRKSLYSSAISAGAMPAISGKSGFVLTLISYTAHYFMICLCEKIEQKTTDMLLSQAYPHMDILCFLEKVQ